MLTGADVCVLRDGLVVENWTIPSYDAPSERPDGPAPAEKAEAEKLDRQGLLDLTADTHPWHRERVVDVERQTMAGTWVCGGHGGIALLVDEFGRIDRQWVIPGTRTLLY